MSALAAGLWTNVLIFFLQLLNKAKKPSRKSDHPLSDQTDPPNFNTHAHPPYETSREGLPRSLRSKSTISTERRKILYIRKK